MRLKHKNYTLGLMSRTIYQEDADVSEVTLELMDIHDRLLGRYGDPHWWPGETPYEVIVGAILTQNTAWGNVEKAIKNFANRLSPEYVAGLEHTALAEANKNEGIVVGLLNTK